MSDTQAVPAWRLFTIVGAAILLVVGAVVAVLGIRASGDERTAAENRLESAHTELERAAADREAAVFELGLAADLVMPEINRMREVVGVAEDLRDRDGRVLALLTEMRDAETDGDADALNAASAELSNEIDQFNDALEELREVLGITDETTTVDDASAGD